MSRTLGGVPDRAVLLSHLTPHLSSVSHFANFVRGCGSLMATAWARAGIALSLAWFGGVREAPNFAFPSLQLPFFCAPSPVPVQREVPSGPGASQHGTLGAYVTQLSSSEP